MAGVVVLGTTKGDIHEIGKQLVGTLLSANGFRVYDLGADVSGEEFAAKALELRADIVGVLRLTDNLRCAARKLSSRRWKKRTYGRKSRSWSEALR